MSAYVDDYKMAGRKANVKPMWDKLIKEGLELEPAVPCSQNTYLGCSQQELMPELKMVTTKRELMTRLTSGQGKPDVSSAGGDDLLDPPATPKAKAKSKAKAKPGHSDTRGAKIGAAANAGSVSFYSYEMFGHVEQTVDRYCELAGKSRDSLKPVFTPCIDDHMIPAAEFDTKGELSPVAARVVLKALYVARIGRLDLMWAVNMLAREVTRWTAACDRRLHRLIAYMLHTKEHAQINFMGDAPADCTLAYFSDASFAGDLRDSKSTSGGILALFGPNTFVPISWLCKKQGAVSHSTSEAEVIALDAGARLEGLPALALWDIVIDVFSPAQAKQRLCNISNKPNLTVSNTTIYDLFGSVDYVPPSLPITYGSANLFLLEDNDAVIKMVVKQRSPQMRHVSRTHRVNLDWLFDRISNDPGCFLKFVGTKEQLADIFTKGSFTAEAWNVLLGLCQVLPISQFKPKGHK